MYIELPKDEKYKKQFNSQLKHDYYAFQVTLTSSQLILKLKTPIKTLSKLHNKHNNNNGNDHDHKDDNELSMSNSYNWTAGDQSVSKSPPTIISSSRSRISSHDNSYPYN